MLSKKQITEQLNYWRTTAEKDLEVMRGLMKLKHYAHALFFGHLTLEKLLKALLVQHVRDFAPRTHHLPYLAEQAGINLTSKQRTLLLDIDTFNMRTRYPDARLTFYKKCTRVFAERYYREIEKIYSDLCQNFEHDKS